MSHGGVWCVLEAGCVSVVGEGKLVGGAPEATAVAGHWDSFI